MWDVPRWIKDRLFRLRGTTDQLSGLRRTRDRLSRLRRPRLNTPPPITTEQALREEALVIVGKDPCPALEIDPANAESLAPSERAHFYRRMNDCELSALCLSGGGIRSAAFSLGVIQALAVHPRSQDGTAVKRADESLLTRFHYLSTVSGGGYIGSWLSAWRARDTWENIWKSLIGRPDGFDLEPAPITWLRSYSNYLTPRLGILSADSWTLIATYLRNLLLNWMLILPFVCALIIAIKLIVASLVASSQIELPLQLGWSSICIPPLLIPLGFGFVGLMCLVLSLSFITRNRPSRRLGARATARNASYSDKESAERDTGYSECDSASSVSTRDRTKGRVKRKNKGERKVLFKRIALSLVSAICLAQCLGSNLAGSPLQVHKEITVDGRFITTGWDLFVAQALTCETFRVEESGVYHPITGWLAPKVSMAEMAAWGAAFGTAIYALGWICGAGWKKSKAAPAHVSLPDIVFDFFCWAVSGAACGAITGLGFHFFIQVPATVPGDSNSMLIALLNSDIMYLILGVPWIMFAYWIADVLFGGLTTLRARYNPDQEWFGRAGGWLLVATLAWFSLLFLVMAGFLTQLTSPLGSALYAFLNSWFLPIGLVASLVIAVLGGGNLSGFSVEAKGIWAVLSRIALAIAAPFFVAAAIFGLSIVLDFLVLGHLLFDDNKYPEMPDDIHNGQYRSLMHFVILLLAAGTISVVCGVGISILVNINRISLHSLYRNRLIRAFLGASAQTRDPDPFTGFDMADNIGLHELWRPEEERIWRPFHVLNITLNVVSSQRLAWQERKAAPFTMSPLHCGTGIKAYHEDPESGRAPERPVGAYRSSREYGHWDGGMSLGTAMAISGAAANPNMGYHSWPAITFLMTMLNVRLGWWLGNPGWEGQSTYFRDGPRNAIGPLVLETFGLTTDEKKYVHLSDGGHFDNLGLYEMVRRRCRFILVSDAGHDPDFTFEDLGNVVRKIAIDLGIPIRLEKLEVLKARSKEKDAVAADYAYYRIGTIEYQRCDPRCKNGVLIYVKPSYHGNESAGIRSYALAHLDFPHQGTANQWFTESQFEAYRSLGFEIMDTILTQAGQRKGMKYADFPSLINLCDALSDGADKLESTPKSADVFCRS
jgi:hypothetical protein